MRGAGKEESLEERSRPAGITCRFACALVACAVTRRAFLFASTSVLAVFPDVIADGTGLSGDIAVMTVYRDMLLAVDPGNELALIAAYNIARVRGWLNESLSRWGVGG